MRDREDQSVNKRESQTKRRGREEMRPRELKKNKIRERDETTHLHTNFLDIKGHTNKECNNLLTFV